MRWVALAFGLGLFSAFCSAKPLPRHWSNQEGASFQASLIWFDGTTVFLNRTKDNREVQVAADRLTDGDRQYLAAWQARNREAKLGFEFGLAGEYFRARGSSSIDAERQSFYMLDANQTKSSLTYTFKVRGVVPPELLSKNPRLLLYINEGKDHGTRGTLQIVYAGKVIAKKKGLRKGGYRSIDLPAKFWGSDPSIELELTMMNNDGLAIRHRVSGSPARLVIMTE